MRPTELQIQISRIYFSIAIVIYKTICIIFGSLIVPIILLKRWHAGKENARSFKEKLANISSIKELNQGTNIWFHCASVGELASISTLIENIKRIDKKINIIVSTTTLSSAKILDNNQDILHIFLPFDNPMWINKFLKKVKPDMCLFVESEIWPNWFLALKKYHAPFYLINARMSDRSYQRWQQLNFFAKNILLCPNLILTQSQADKDKFAHIIQQEEKVIYAGNLKYTNMYTKKADNSFNKYNLLLTSSHDGEEIMMIKVLLKLKPLFPKLKLIIMPRHPERMTNIKLQLNQDYSELKINCYSQTNTITTDVNTIDFIDTIGVSKLFFEQSGIAIMGKSFHKKGGQNPIEPVSFGLPTICGQYMSNFQEITHELSQADLIYQTNEHELAQSIQNIIEKDDSFFKQFQEKSINWINEKKSQTLNNYMNIISKGLK